MIISFLWALAKVMFFSFVLATLILQSNNLIVVFLKQPMLWVLTMFGLSYSAFYLSSLLSTNVGLILWIVVIAYLYTYRGQSISRNLLIDGFFEELGISKGRLKHRLAYWFYVIGAVLGWFNFYGKYQYTLTGEASKISDLAMNYIKRIPVEYFLIAVTGVVILSLAIYLLNSYEKNSRKINMNNKLLSNVLFTIVSSSLGVLALYYFKEPNAKFLKTLIKGGSKWVRDDYELYIRKSEGFFSLKNFDLNWLAGVAAFVVSFALISLVWRYRSQLKGAVK